MDIDSILNWIFSNFGLFMLMVAVIGALLNHFLRKKESLVEIFYRWLAFFPLGVTAIYAFYMHAFMPEFTAASIGWPNSPFQFEVAMANLAFGVIALMSIFLKFEFRLAVVVANTCWLWGDAIGHSYRIIVDHNLTIGNAGSWFYMDWLMPALLICCLIASKNHSVRLKK